MVLCDPDAKGGRHKDAGLLAETTSDDFRADGIGSDQPARAVLFGGAHRHDDAGTRLQVVLHFLPSGKTELHDVPRRACAKTIPPGHHGTMAPGSKRPDVLSSQ